MSRRNQIVSLSHEKAHDEVERLTNVERFYSEGADVVRGQHPEWGPTVIIFPPFGNAIGVPLPDYLKPEITAIQNATV